MPCPLWWRNPENALNLQAGGHWGSLPETRAFASVFKLTGTLPTVLRPNRQQTLHLLDCCFSKVPGWSFDKENVDALCGVTEFTGTFISIQFLTHWMLCVSLVYD